MLEFDATDVDSPPLDDVNDDNNNDLVDSLAVYCIFVRTSATMNGIDVRF